MIPKFYTLQFYNENIDFQITLNAMFKLKPNWTICRALSQRFQRPTTLHFPQTFNTDGTLCSTANLPHFTTTIQNSIQTLAYYVLAISD